MAGYTVISDIGNAIVQLLRDNLVPEILVNTENIGLCTPADRGDIVLGVNLYDVRENEDIAATSMVSEGVKRQRYPSTFYNLYYMVTAFSASDVKFRAAEEQKIMGRVLQVMKDHAMFSAELLGETLASSQYPPKIEALSLENDEKMKLWNVPNVPYKFSLFYRVYPVEIESTRVKTVQRVTEAELSFQELPLPH